LNAVVDLYRGKNLTRVTRFHRGPRAATEFESLVVFPHFQPDEILEVALGGARLPAGITRHVSRVAGARINVALELLSDRSRSTLERRTSGWPAGSPIGWSGTPCATTKRAPCSSTNSGGRAPMPSVRFIGQADVTRLLPMAACVPLMAEVLKSLARGDAQQPLRSVIRLPGRNAFLGTMPACVGQPLTTGVKIITVFPDNHGTPLDSHQGVVLLFDSDRGSLLAILDATSITEIRTAAASGAATDALARPDARALGILGSGVQASAHLAAMRAVRPIARAIVWSRDPKRARTFAASEAARHGIAVEAAERAEDAVRGADIVCTATSATTPVLHGEWLAPGTHVNAVGACFPTSRGSTPRPWRGRGSSSSPRVGAHEAGDPSRFERGLFTADHIVAEIGEVPGLGVRPPVRREITVFKSLGLGVEDSAAARHAYEGTWRPSGTVVELGGARRGTA
jgi:ornithine cyclodeaminase